jgi:hypothetical protein
LTLDSEGAVIAADWDQAALPPREAGSLLVATLGSLKPSVGVAAQHRARPHRRQLAEPVDLSQIATERLIVGDRRITLLQPSPVGVQQPCPDISSRPQLLITTTRLLAGETQPNTCGAMDMNWDRGRHIELMFVLAFCPVKDGSVTVDN